MSICVFSLLFIYAPCAFTAEEFQFGDIVKILDHSGKQFNYLGTKFVIDYTSSQQSTTLVKITYGATGWQKKEVSPFESGKSQIILDDGKSLWHYIPSQASVVKKQRNLSLGDISKRIHRRNELIQQNYHITIYTDPQEIQPIHASQVPAVPGDVLVSLQPKVANRPSWKIWIDSEHGLVVRTEVYDINGNLALLSAFSELTFQPEISKQSFTITVPKGTKMRTSVEKSFPSIAEAQQEVSFPISEPEYIPQGFTLASVILSKTRQTDKIQLAYIDGMSSISVFEEKRVVSAETPAQTTPDEEIEDSVKGTFHDQGLLKILRWRLNQDLYVTLVGEVADSELLKIASSIIK